MLAAGAIACSGLVVPSAGQVVASTGDSSVSSSRFLGGSLLLDSVDLDTIAVLAGTNSSNSGTPTADTDTATLDLTTLMTANVTVPGGVSLGVFPSVLQIGAVNHYSQASDEGISRSASGAVSNAGAVDTTGSGSFPSNAQISLDPLLTGSAFTGVISELDLSAGAITGVAALNARQGSPATTCTDLSAPLHCLDYNVADAKVELTSPAIAELAGLVSAVAVSVDAELDVLAGADGTLADALTSLTGVALSSNVDTVITIDSTVTTALDAVLDTALSDGIVSIDLRTGGVVADLDLLLQDVTGTGVNSLAPNTEVLSAAVLTELADRVDALLATVPAVVESAVDAAVLSSTVTIDVDVCLASCLTNVTIDVVGTISEILAGSATATIVVVVGGLPVVIAAADLLVSLQAPINAVLTTLDTVTIPGAMASLVTAVTTRSALVRVALTSLSSIVSLKANVQEAGSTTGSHREVALRLTLGDLIGAGGLATVDLGAAEVGRNTVVPTRTSMTPDRGTANGGTSVTIVGTDFVAGETTVNVDGGSVTPSIVSSTSLTFATPAHAAGPVPVTVTTPGGTTAPLTFTYLPVPVESSMIPVRGPVAGGTSVTITGSGFMVGETDVLIGGNAAVPTVASSTELSFVTPAHALGEVDVTVTTPGGTSAPLTYTYDPVPVESSMIPVRGPVAGGTTVTITGSGFVDGETDVLIGGNAAVPTVASSTELSFVTPAHALGPVPVTVTTPGGTSNPLTYTYDPVPVETSMTPVRGPVAGGTSVTITGSGFIDGETDVLIGGNLVVPTATAATELTFVTPAHVLGEVDVTVTTPGGTSAPLTYTYDPIPVETSMTPARGPVAGGTTVTITGSGFIDGQTDVLIGGNAAVPTVASSTELTFVTPAHVLGEVDVTVTTPGGTSSPALKYNYDPIPTAASLSVDRGPLVGGTSVTVTGSGFVPGETTVNVGGTSVTAVVSNPTTLTFVTPQADDPGSVVVTVTTPGGTSDPLSFIYDPIPTGTSIVPARGPIAGGTTVTVTGTGFIAGNTSVQVGSKLVTPTVTDPTTLTFVTPQNDAGSVQVTITTPGGTSDPLTFFFDPVPTESSLSPDRGPISGGTVVTISGAGFVVGSTDVTIGTETFAATVASPTSLTFMTPAHALGPVNVTVTTPGGTSTPLTYTYDLIPNAASLSPEHGPLSGGTTVTVTGSGFESGQTSVTFDGGEIPTSEVAVTGTTSLQFVTPAHIVGGVEVTVTTPGGTSSPALDYTYEPVPTETSIDPDRGPDSGGATVTITGTGFVADETKVWIDAIERTATVSSPTSLTFVTPAHAAGTVPVLVTTPGGSSTANLTYTFDPVPTESSLTPVSGPVGGGTVVSITGTGFVVDRTTVRINTTPVDSADVTVTNETSLTFTTPAHSAGSVNVTVTTPGGTSNPLAYTYEVAPTIDEMTPPRGPLGGGMTVTVAGTGFIQGQTNVTVDGSPMTVAVSSPTRLTFVNPAHAAGPANVAVSTAGGTSAPAVWMYDPQPTTAPLLPARGIAAGGALITIDGTGFVDGFTSASIDGADVPVNVGSATLVTFIAPAHAAGVVDVVVSTTGGVAEPQSFTYLPVPEMNGLDVTSGPAAGGTSVTIEGEGFLVDESTVMIGNAMIRPSSVEVAAAGTSLTFVTPAHQAGAALVVVQTPGGVASPPLDFNFAAPAPLVPGGGLLPETGLNTGGLLAPAGLLLIFGGLFLALSTGRRRELTDAEG